MGYKNRFYPTALKTAHLEGVVQSGKLQPGSSTTVMTGIGLFAGNSLATDAGTAIVDDNFGICFQQTSSSVSGNNVANLTADARLKLAIGFDSIVVCRFSRTTNIRLVFGLGAGLTLGNFLDADTISASFIGVQYSTPRGDTKLQFVTSNGTSQTVVDTGVTFAAGASDIYQLRIETLSSTTVRLTLLDENGVTLATHTTTLTLPASSVLLRPIVAHEPENTTPTLQYSYLYAAQGKGIKQA